MDGVRPRSDQAAQRVVADVFGVETLALELADPRFYHHGHGALPAAGGEVMYVPAAFTSAGCERSRPRGAGPSASRLRRRMRPGSPPTRRDRRTRW